MRPNPAEDKVEILIAEDSPTQAERLRYLLEEQHYRVTAVENGRLALAFLDGHTPALVISDINMPELDGYALCRRIKAIERLRDIPVILLTSLSDAQDVLEGLACGAEGFITKPYSNNYLLEHVARTLASGALPLRNRTRVQLEIPLSGNNRVITADPQRMVSLLVSTYEAAIHRNTELVQTQDALQSLNEHLEDLVEDRTATLSAEIAERKQAEARILYLAGVLEHVSDGIVSTDMSGTIQSWNSGAEAMFGYRAAAVLGRPYTEVVVYDYLTGDKAAALQEAADTGRWKGEVRARRQDGSLLYILVAGAALKDNTGAVTGFSAVLHDITERKLAEAALRKSDERFRSYFELGLIGMAISSPAKGILEANDQLCAMLGYSRPELLNKSWTELTHPDDLELDTASFNQVLAGEIEGYTLDKRWIRQDGGIIDATIALRCLRLPDGSVDYFVALLNDITERKRRELELVAIAAVVSALRSADTQAQMVPIVLEQVMGLLDAVAASLAMRDPATDELVMTLGNGEMAGLAGQRLPAGAGIGGHVLATGQPYISTNTAADQYYYPMNWLSEAAPRAVACVPLVSSSHVLGVVWAARATPFSEVEVRVLSAVAGIAASAIQRAGLHEQTEQQLQRLAALREIDGAIMNSVDLRVTLTILLSHATAQLGVDASDILLLNPGLNLLEYAAGRGFRSTAIEQSRLRLGEGHAGQAALERRLVAAPDLHANPMTVRRDTLLAGESFASQFCVPLLAKGRVLGVLEVFHRAPLNPDANWLGFLETLGGQAAIAVADAALFNELQRSNSELLLAYDTTLEGWSAALDLRDKETEGHSQRVTEMTLRLAQVLSVNDGELEHIRRGALLHDIGKMAIPDEILLKPGKLTDDEWTIMRRHPRVAYELLSPIAFLRLALTIPYCHHEKWDGTGYPRQLKGDEIPLSARIFAVVDVWDALRSERPYRPGWPDDRVRAYIAEQAGKHFDPRVASAFLALIEAQPEAQPASAF